MTQGHLSRRTLLRGGLALGALGAVSPSEIFAQNADPEFSQTMMNTIRGSFVTTAREAFTHPSLASESEEPVGARLLCVFDASSSVDNREYTVQQNVTAAALRSPDFKEAVYSGPGSLAIAFMAFGSRADIVIPWLDIRQGDDDKFEQLAQSVEALSRPESGSTYHIRALHYAMLSMGYCPWQAQRGIVDFMTDGKDNDSFTPREPFVQLSVRQLAEEFNTTVNTLLTINPTGNDGDLEEWANANLLTPAGLQYRGGQFVNPGFSKVVAFESTDDSTSAIVRYEREMEIAFKEKLIREVVGLPDQYFPPSPFDSFRP